MANTVIQLKFSEVTAAPPSLNVAEPAYSNTSGKLFIGDANQAAILIGGKYYVDRVDEATSANTSNVIVKRDSDGSFSASVVKADLYGNANSATQLQTVRYINLSGKATGTAAFDGTANADIAVELDNTTVVSGDYGGTTKIPVFTVDEDGRLTAAANVDVATTLNIQGDTGTDAIALLDDTLTFVGGDGITSVVDNAGDNVTFSVDNTVIRTTGGQTIEGDFSISGNLVISGNTITLDTETLQVNDSIILLAANNDTGDSIDIGIAGHYGVGGNNHTGFVRHAADGRWYLFENYEEHFIHDFNTINIAHPTFVTANLVANLRGGKVTDLTQAIAIADGGTNATSFPTGNLVFFDGTSLTGIANTGIAAGTYGSADRTQVVQVDTYGRVVALTNTAIAIDTTQVISGTLPIARGGTNQTSYTTGAIVQFDGTSLASLANTGTAGTYGAENYIPVVTTDVYGRVSAVSNTAVGNLSAAIITSGTLPVARGGTGNTSFTTSGILMGQGTSAITTVESSTEGHVLQINASGVPTFAHLNGGFF
jgi:hypothetical protein